MTNINKLKRIKKNEKLKLQTSLKTLGSRFTQARVGLQRSGTQLSTNEILKFNFDHAKARYAVHCHWHFQNIIQALQKKGEQTLQFNTNALSREQYLLNPPSGQMLHDNDHKKITDLKTQYDICIVVTDGLSAVAIDKNFIAFWNIFSSLLNKIQMTISPIIFVPFGRVAVADHVGELFKSKISIIFVGERPGLSAADSMGIYFTYEPLIGKQNSERNCISNVRVPLGLSYYDASQSLIHLIEESLRLGYSGTQLKMGV